MPTITLMNTKAFGNTILFGNTAAAGLATDWLALGTLS
jgi:hypothetical protein